jgi:hypothetical protein
MVIKQRPKTMLSNHGISALTFKVLAMMTMRRCVVWLLYPEGAGSAFLQIVGTHRRGLLLKYQQLYAGSIYLPSLCGIAAKTYDDIFIVVNRKIRGKTGQESFCPPANLAKKHKIPMPGQRCSSFQL